MDSNSAFVGDYEVFLSFRGKDTRQGFTDILYEYMTMADIRVYRDDDELAIGDKIESILKAIESSKICIPIFSPNFAESKWCLREVTRMVELEKMIVPVFYKVSTDDVKLKEKSVYADDFKNLQLDARGDPVEIDNWKNALREAASNKGRALRNKSYTQFCKEFISEVLSKLGPRARLDVDHFVGDTNKAKALKLLDMGSSSNEVVYLGIHGMGGIGKTTLTKLIYNEFLSSFDYCGFVPDIREFSANKGVDDLPTYLCDNLKPKNVVSFSHSKQIPNLFKNKKILLILDDVDSDEQIKKIAREPCWFGSGSRIILTSRDKKVFKDFELASKCEIQYLEMDELEHGWSLELFSRCAFGESSPPSPYQDLSKRAVDFAGGLPLAITVIAKYLRNEREAAVWEDIIERLQKTLPEEVKDKLLISYDSLKDEQKKIFLDMTCLFNQKSYSERSHIFYMWQACGLYPSWSLEVLQSRSLVKLVKSRYGDDFHFQIHDQLRDLGKDIGGDMRKKISFSGKNKAMEVLKCKKKQKKMIEAISFCVFPNMTLTEEEIFGFDNLRYLDMHRSKFSGDFSNLFPKLAWLRYYEDLLEVRNLAPPNLAILDLSTSDVDEKWNGWRQILMSNKLKVLDLSRCKKLRRTTVFPENIPLETLNLYGCESLEYIDPSIGKLHHLIKLNLYGCGKLENLHDFIGELLQMSKKFKVLDLSWAFIKMQRTPVFLEDTHLEELNLSSCYLLEYIDPSIGKLQHLTNLNLRRCKKLKNLPDSIGGLMSLKCLDLSECEMLQRTPVFLEDTHLEELNLSSCYLLEYIDPSIGKLQHLTNLNLSGCKNLKNLPGSIGGLMSLKHLSLARCAMLQRTPVFVENMNLEMLNLYNCSSLEYIDTSIGKLQHLTELNLEYTHSLVELPESLRNLHSLRELYLIKSGLTRLPDSIIKLEKLEKLNLGYCYQLQELPPKLPSSLKDLFIRFYGLKNNSVPDLSNLHQLTDLQIDGARFNLLASDFEELQSLTYLTIERCSNLVSLINLDKLKKLRKLVLSECPSLVGIPGVGELRSLTELRLVKCDSLEWIDDITGLEELQVVTLSHCKKLTKVPGLVNLKSLRLLDLEGCRSKREILEVASELEELHGVEVKRDFISGYLSTSESENMSGDDEVEVDNCNDNDM